MSSKWTLCQTLTLYHWFGLSSQNGPYGTKTGPGQVKRHVGPFLFHRGLLTIGPPVYIPPAPRQVRKKTPVAAVKGRLHAVEGLRIRAQLSRAPARLKNSVLGSTSTNRKSSIFAKMIIVRPIC